MEIRNITQVKIYKLFLSDMRLGALDLAAVSYEKEKLVNFLTNELSESYAESEDVEIEEGIFETLTFNKSFKKNGPLEWFTPETIQDDMFPSQWINEPDLEEFRQKYPSVPFID